MKNDEYWQKRAEQRLIESEQIAARAEKEMKKAFDAAYKDIELQIYKLYGKYARDNELSYADTLAYLTDNERKEFQKDLSFYIAKAKDGNYRKEYRAYLQALSVRARVKRLEAYQAQLKVIAEQLYEEQIIPQATAVMQTVTLDSYLKAAFDISQGVGLLMAFDMPSQRIIDHVLQYPWSGKSFSQKWIDNCADFESILDQVLTKGLVAGSSNQKIARELADKTGQAYNRALRLVRTETNYAHGQAAKAMYEQLGVEEYRFEATLDIKTSKICRSLDGQKFLVKDFTPGVNANAMHPWCRSTTTPVVYEDRIGTRAARDKDGKKYNVPGNMTYEQWYDKYVKTDPEYLKVEKMYKNQWADRKQYEQYKRVLGSKKAPKTFEKFQDIKYNDIERWKALKRNIRQTGGKYTRGDVEWGLRRIDEADKYYENIRSRIDDVEKISKNTGWNKESIERIKDHVFIRKHRLENGAISYLDSDYDMAVAWKRMIEGKPLDRDILLLKHEHVESIIENKFKLSNKAAHDRTEQIHNWREKLLKDTEGLGENDCLYEKNIKQ